ncbi:MULTISPECIES: hypothetical protein [Chryseobacterium]|uniref:hypothetical protein n=1 Tax=Chryseobacterium TaxID=59732 RepID=UPI001297C55B|nr:MULTISPECIES: hypothetical protein [Chryseobacterium]MDR6923408.1 hypothetical protein [Chryseobacterium sp. 2987]
MKKGLALLSLAAFSFGSAQKGPLILNNYSKYDFEGYIIASNSDGGCYPLVTSADPDLVKIPADSHMYNGHELRYNDYQDQFNNSLYPMAAWSVMLSATNTTTIPWNDPSLSLGGFISDNTKWAASKFAMYYPGTHNNAPDNFGGTVSIFSNCYNTTPNFTTPSGNMAEIFTIDDGVTLYTYIQLY